MSAESAEMTGGDLYANWAKVYDYFFGDRTAEIEFWARMAAPYGRHVLDLMCGTAEVSLALARRGFGVTGMDLSSAMLAIGAERLAAAADYPARGVAPVQGDAVALPLADAACDFALVGGNGSFNHLDAGGAARALAELRRVVRPGGGVGMELLNPHLLPEIYPERSFGPFRPTPPGVWVEKTSANRYDRDAGLFHIEQVTHFEIGGEQGEFAESFALHAWLPEQVRALFDAAGFASVRFYGGYDLVPFDEWSADLLVVATTPG
ncbi:MAG: class I SAM-dependent methyltransferase [Anaerolineae bacterium]|nr:class I SAM-dependent methyltransferase [Anaerolineae bacterium]